MVNKQNMLLWVEALESGEFKQAAGFLRITGMEYAADADRDHPVTRYCCLGVATEIAVRSGLELSEADKFHCEEMLEDDPEPEHPYDVWSLNESTLSHSVRQWLGADDGDPDIAEGDAVFDGGRVRISTIQANDDLEWDFNKIAAELRTFYELGPKA